ncbi:MAG: putative neutral zinc metallopeptidase [Erysipelotrichaceae bacterium]|nr:MAG: putative neutral zinc [Erysipelotrichaceae bacterium]TXT16870.1 MAG: putative neutral zinc metallopeptidase [Erysipelotrichaceae bacterium]
MDILLYVAAIGLALWAQAKVTNAYAHFSKVMTEKRISGYTVARSILDSHGLSNVEIQVSQKGLLSDHYDPKTNTVNLSPKVYNEASIASVAVAAHEVGHAIQHAEHYSYIGVRNAILPFAIVSSYAGWITAIIGLLSSLDFLFYIGLVMLVVIATFQLVTLPLEFDASKRALLNLAEGNYINADEVADSKSMLSAAAMTYLAAFAASLLQITRLLLMRGRRR